MTHLMHLTDPVARLLIVPADLHHPLAARRDGIGAIPGIAVGLSRSSSR